MLAGMFTLTSEIMSGNNLLATSVRSSLVPYRSAIVELAFNLAWIFPLVTGITSGPQNLTHYALQTVLLFLFVFL